ncbi:InlB B-repeat-containing protein, partial [Enterococcus termitis]
MPLMKKYPHSLAHVKQNSASKWQFIEFARWAYPITWNGNGANGGHIPPNGTVIEGDQIYIAGSPTRTGHRFEGWFNTTSQSGGHEYTTGAYMPPGNLTLYARWTRNNYTQSFNGNGHTGGTIPGTRTVAYDATSTVPAGPTRTGYTFVGWFDGANGASGAQLTTSFKQLAYNITWTARWQANTYTESFYRSKVVPNTAGYNDHTKPTNKWLESLTSLTRTVTFDQTYSAPVYTTPPGYTFLGWYEDIGTIADASGAKIGEQFPATPYAFGKFTNAGNKAIHYLLKPNKYALTLDFNGNGTGPRTQDVYYDSEYNINGSFPYPKRIGYIFEGWHTAATGGTKVTDTELYTATSDTTLYAQWTKDPYAIRKTDDPTEDIEIDETKDNAVILSGNKNELRIDYVPSYDFRLDKKKNEEDVQYP